MVKCTSKAAYLDLKDSGTEQTQADKILAIISSYEGISLSEILRAYRSQYGAIELSSVSGRCTLLKDNKLIEEKGTRPCTVTGKTINILWAKDRCTHEAYRNKHHIQLQNMDRGTVWYSAVIQTCKDCGADISQYRLVEIKNHREYLKGLK